MKKLPLIVLLALCWGAATIAIAATPESKKQQFKWSGPYSGPVTGSSIYKILDEDLGVVCYVMHPDNVAYHMGSGIEYEGNSVGAISCVKLPATSNPRKAQ